MALALALALTLTLVAVLIPTVETGNLTFAIAKAIYMELSRATELSLETLEDDSEDDASTKPAPINKVGYTSIADGDGNLIQFIISDSIKEYVVITAAAAAAVAAVDFIEEKVCMMSTM